MSATEALPAGSVPVCAAEGDAKAAVSSSHVLAGVSAADLSILAAMRSELAERRLALEAEALLESVLAPRLRTDAAIRDAYARFFAPPASGGAEAELPTSLTRCATVPLSERLDPRRTLAGAPVAVGESGTSWLPLLSGSGAAAASSSGGLGLAPAAEAHSARPRVRRRCDIPRH